MQARKRNAEVVWIMDGLPILPAWKREAVAKLAKKGVALNDFPGNVFRKDFFKTVGNVYFDGLVENEKLTSTLIGKRLGLNNTTAWRWVRGDTTAGADKFFALLLFVLRKEIQTVNVGKRETLLFEAIRRQCTSLAVQFCHEPSVILDRIGFKALMRMMQLPAVNHHAPGEAVDESEKAAALKDAAVQVNAMLKVDFDERAKRTQSIAGKAKRYAPTELNELLTDWGLPYTLFAMGCTRKLGVEDV